MPISAAYFAAFCATGLLLPFLPPYLHTLGFDGRELAIALAAGPALGIFVPPLWGFVADRLRSSSRVLALCTALAALAFVPLLLLQSFPLVLLALALFYLFASPISGLLDAVAGAHARRSGGSFPRLRLWGSVGFLASSLGFGVARQLGAPAEAVLPVTLVALLGSAAMTRLLPVEPAVSGRPRAAEALGLLARPGFLPFVVAGMFHWAAAGPFHMFYALHLEQLGAPPVAASLGLLLAVGAEVALFWKFAAVQGAARPFALIVAGMLVGAVRWGIAATATGPWVVVASQLLHAVTFGAFYAASMAHLEHAVPEHLRATGRAVYGAIVFGVGGVLGNAVAGPLFDAGGARFAFEGAIALELCAAATLGLAGWVTRRRALIA